MKTIRYGWIGRGLLAAAITAGLLLLGGSAFANIPISVTQQGKLLDDSGEPMTGDVDLEFTLYDSATGGTILWSDSISTTLDDNGVYSVTLGDSAQPIDSELLMGGEVYLALAVNGADEMSPRVELTSVPFATMAGTAQVAQSVEDGAITSDSVDSIEWSKITDVPAELTESSDLLAELQCNTDEVPLYDGSQWGCSGLDFPTYSGEDFATADQSCGGDDVVGGINASGDVICVSQQDTTYSGSDFATSGQDCSGDQVAVGINNSGSLICSSPTIDTENLANNSVTQSKIASGAVGPGEIDGPVQVYTPPTECSGSALTLSTTCQTAQCSTTGCGAQASYPCYYECGSTSNCFRSTSETCSTELVGYLVGD